MNRLFFLHFCVAFCIQKCKDTKHTYYINSNISTQENVVQIQFLTDYGNGNYIYSMTTKHALPEEDYGIVQQIIANDMLIQAHEIHNFIVSAYDQTSMFYKKEEKDKISVKAKINSVNHATYYVSNLAKLKKEHARELLINMYDKCYIALTKLEPLHNALRNNFVYKRSSAMDQQAINNLDIRKHMHRCMTKHIDNADTFDKQTLELQRLMQEGRVNYITYMQILTMNVVYYDYDKAELANEINARMTAFLTQNIAKLTRLLPKMQFFVHFYNNNQNDYIFCRNTKTVCMIFAMMHIIEVLLDVVEPLRNHVHANMRILHNRAGIEMTLYESNMYKIAHYADIKHQIEKMFLFVLHPFVSSAHFLDLVSLCLLEYYASFGCIRSLTTENQKYKRCNRFESMMTQMSELCYLYVDTPKYNKDIIPITKVTTHASFLVNICNPTYEWLRRSKPSNQTEIQIQNKCLSMYILTHRQYIQDNLVSHYNNLVTFANCMQSLHKLPKAYCLSYIEVPDNEAIEQHKQIVSFFNATDFAMCKRIAYGTNSGKPVMLNFYSVCNFVLHNMYKYIVVSSKSCTYLHNITRNTAKIVKAIDYHMDIIYNWFDIKKIERRHNEKELMAFEPRIVTTRDI